MRNFATCHSHPQSLDSASTPEAFAEREVELGTGVLTCTDHGTLQACRKIYDLGKANNLIPVLGMEAYLRDDDCQILTAHGYRKNETGAFVDAPKYMHVTIHFLDQAAYETGVRLLSMADARLEATLQKLDAKDRKHGEERKPLFTWSDLEELGAQNTTMTTGCMIGLVQRHLMENNDLRTATAYFEKLKSIVKPGNLYTELFPHDTSKNWVSGVFITAKDGSKIKVYKNKVLLTDVGEIEAGQLAKAWAKGEHHVLRSIKDRSVWREMPEIHMTLVEQVDDYLPNECRPWAPDGDLQAGLNKVMRGLAARYGTKILIGDDSHFARQDEKVVQDVRMAQKPGAWRFYGSYHRQSSEEALAHFQRTIRATPAEFEGWVENSHEWASRFKDFVFHTPPSLPTKFYEEKYELRPWFKAGSHDNSLRYMMELVNKHGRMDWGNAQYVSRLKAEIALLHNNGTIDLLPYFFIDEEVCSEYEKAKELTGPGRGSAAGLLLTYLIGITHVDPLKYELSMDRFLTVDRIQSGKLPDIDQDLPHRELLVDPEHGWLKQRFGDHVAQISVDTTLKLKMAVKDVSRARRGFVLPDIEDATKKFIMPPQGVEDYDFVMGYDTDEGRVQGSVDYDPALQDYIRRHPEDWRIVQKCLGLSRQKSRHACLPRGEAVLVKTGRWKDITECDGSDVYTGQGLTTSKGWQQSGRAKLIDQGTREVVEYLFDTGAAIRCTPDHLILTEERGWVEIQQACDQGLTIKAAVNRTPVSERTAREYARSRGGELLIWNEDVSKGTSTWRCASGHEWSAPAGRVFSYKYWCRKCSHAYRFQPTKSDIRRAAGKCLSTYRRYDASRGHACDLNIEDVISAKRALCVYCDRPATGFERKDNSAGHTKDNCVPACLRCNWMRGRYVSHEVMLHVGNTLKKVDP